MAVAERASSGSTPGYSMLVGHAAGMPSFPDGRRPAAESRRRKALIHTVALLALLATLAYLAWRVLFTIDLAVWWVAVPLLVLELHNALGLGMFTLALWDVDAGPRATSRDASDWRVAVLITTYNEPEDVLLPTIAAAVALRPAHETWVLDDGHRPEVARLAAALGARYLSRPSNEHAKAGNLNYALETVEADLVAVLDADHIARPDFLRHTIGYFDNPSLALVQTPQDFYNLDSFEHQIRGGDRLFNEEAVFYRVIAAAKNRWDAAFWCGTSAILRVEALRSVGGVATGTVTEDIQTSIRLHRRGWKTCYHNEVLARGLAPRTATEYMLQRHRWATGAMQVLRRERLLGDRQLSLAQRISYATTLWGWFDAWRSLGYILIPVAVIATGAMPIHASIEVFAPLFLGTLAIQFAALRLLARGYYPPLLSILFEFLRMPAVLSGTLALLHGRARPFEVTPKGATDTRSRTRIPGLMLALLASSGAALAWFALTDAGLTPMHYRQPGAVLGAAVFLLGNSLLLAAAALRIRERRFAPERRAGVRLPVIVHGSIAGDPCTVLDLSLTGARVISAAAGAELGADVPFEIALPNEAITISATVVRRISIPEGRLALGLEFTANQPQTLARLAIALLATKAERQADSAGFEPSRASTARARVRRQRREQDATLAGATPAERA